MSSLAAACADGYYYPREWDPSKGSISKFQGSKGANQWEQSGVIRFELPYHCWCEGCGRHIGKGTRFNAKKEKAGKYYSTTIWAFKMKCATCPQRFVIKTDPKNTDYEFAEGIKAKTVNAPEEVEDRGLMKVGLGASDVRAKSEVDPMYAMEHEQEDRRAASAEHRRLHDMMVRSRDSHQADYDINAAMRRKARGHRKLEREKEKEATDKGLGIRLLTPSPADAAAAKLVRFRGKHQSFVRSEKQRKAAIRGSGIFGTPAPMGTGASKALAAVAMRESRGIRTSHMRVLEGEGASQAEVVIRKKRRRKE